MEEKTKQQLIQELGDLRRSEEQYRLMIAAMSDGYVLTRDDRILFANPAMAEMLGCTIDEVVGRSWKDFLEPEMVDYIVQTPLIDLPPLLAAEVQRPDGKKRTFELAIRSAFYQGELAEFTLVRDITERKRTEEALRRLAKELDALQATVLDIITPHDPSTLLETIVQRAASLLDTPSGTLYLCEPEKRQARCVVSYNTPRDYRGIVLRYDEGATGTVTVTKEPLIIDDYRNWSGRATVFEEEQPFTAVLSAPMIWQDRVTGVIHLLHDAESRRFSQSDLNLLSLLANHAAIAVQNTRLYEKAQKEIADRKRAEEALQRRVAELEALRTASLHLTSQLELQPVLESLLRQVVRLSGAGDAHIFLYDGERLAFSAALLDNGPKDQPLAEPRPDGLTYNVARSGERILIPDVNAHPLFQDWRWGGAIMGLPLRVGKRVVGVMNIAFPEPHPFGENELRLLELLATQAAIAIQNANLYEQVQRHAVVLEQQVAERTRELAKANERLQELERLKSKFIADISHELRTPLTNVRLGLHLLEHGKPEQRTEYLVALRTQFGRLARLVEEIVQFSQLELGRIEFVPVDLNSLVEQVIIALQPDAETSGLELAFSPDGSLPPVRGQAQQLLRLITELVDNALTYTKKGRVHISTCLSPDGSQLLLEVQDTGMGIEPEDLPHVFERFYRGREVGSSTIPGAGLGLAIANEITDLHGGQIEVESEVGKGSTFTVRLPMYR